MSFIKRYWFGGLIAFIVCFFMLLFILLVMSPKDDADKRGFVKCTHEMIDNLSDCNKGFYCTVKAIMNNTWCNVKVIAEGVDLWIDNKQKYPWSNYIYEPIIVDNSFFDEEARTEYLKKYPDVKRDMMRLNKLRKDLENEENNQEYSEEMLQKE